MGLSVSSVGWLKCGQCCSLAGTYKPGMPSGHRTFGPSIVLCQYYFVPQTCCSFNFSANIHFSVQIIDILPLLSWQLGVSEEAGEVWEDEFSHFLIGRPEYYV